MKKTLLALLVASILLTACGGETSSDGSTTENNSGASTSTTQEFTPGEYPLSEEKIDLTVFASPPAWIEDMETNTFTLWYEDLTNVHVNWQIEKSDPAAKINLMLASNTDIPEVFLNSISSGMLSTYGSKGVFLPINDYIEKYGVETKKLFEYNSDIEKVITAPDGNIYGLPYFNECLHCEYGQKAWVNTKFLDAVGMDVPQTTEDFEKMLVAFKNEDPNGNGQQDEIPFSASYSVWHGSIEGFLMSPFIYYDGYGYSHINVMDGKLVPAYTQEGWRNGLRWIRSLYEQGLIDPQAFTQDNAQLTAIADAEPSILGAYASGGPNGTNNPAGDKIYDYMQWIPPLEGPDGTRYTMYNKYQHIEVGASFVITDQCKNPEIAFMWADGFYNDEIHRRKFNGEPGVAWEEPGPDDLGIDGQPALYKQIIQWGSEQNSAWCSLGNYKVTNTERHGEAVPNDGSFSAQKLLYDATVGNDEVPGYIGFEPPEDMILPPLYMSAEETEKITEIEADISDYVKESFALFVVGEMDLDADWDEYLQTLDAYGLPTLLEVKQAAYDRQYGE